MKASSTALLVIDMQEFFRSMSTSILTNLTSLLDAAESVNLPFVFTQHGHSPSELNGTTLNQLVRKWGTSQSIHTDSPEWEIIPELTSYVEKSLTSMPVPKNTYDAFINSDLEVKLRVAGVDSVIVTGVMTNCCVDTTARSAFNRGFTTYLVSDACATATRRMHDTTLENFAFAYGDVVRTAEMLKMIEEAE